MPVPAASGWPPSRYARLMVTDRRAVDVRWRGLQAGIRYA